MDVPTPFNVGGGAMPPVPLGVHVVDFLHCNVTNKMKYLATVKQNTDHKIPVCLLN